MVVVNKCDIVFSKEYDKKLTLEHVKFVAVEEKK